MSDANHSEQVIKAHSEAKPSLCFNLLSAAISHCHLLGLHREKTYSNRATSDNRRIRRVFWTLYIFDKNTSLLFGRSSLIQDPEVDVSYPEVSSQEGMKPWDESFLKFIELARLHGQTYQDLFSIKALADTVTARSLCAHALTMAMATWKAELDSVGHLSFCEQWSSSLTAM